MVQESFGIVVDQRRQPVGRHGAVLIRVGSRREQDDARATRWIVRTPAPALRTMIIGAVRPGHGRLAAAAGKLTAEALLDLTSLATIGKREGVIGVLFIARRAEIARRCKAMELV